MTSIKLFNAIIAPMNRELKNSSKVKISRYHLDRIIEIFIDNGSYDAIHINKNTIKRYIKEFRQVIVKAESQRFEHLNGYTQPLLKIEYRYDGDDSIPEVLEFYLFVIADRYIYLSKKFSGVMADCDVIVIKEDCFKYKYLASLKDTINESAYTYLLHVCRYVKPLIRLYPSTLYQNLVVIAFRINIKADNSVLTLKYMKDIFREFPLFR